MNRDETHSDGPRWNEPELEARIVAWASGEASAFEAAELARLAEQRPEVAVFKRRIEAVRELVRDAVKREQAPLRLASERRKKLLETLSGGVSASATQDGALTFKPVPKRWRWPRWPVWMMSAAASVALVLITAVSIESMTRHSKKSAMVDMVEVQMPEAPSMLKEEAGAMHQPSVAARSVSRKRKDLRETQVAVEKRRESREPSFAARSSAAVSDGAILGQGVAGRASAPGLRDLSLSLAEANKASAAAARRWGRTAPVDDQRLPLNHAYSQQPLAVPQQSPTFDSYADASAGREPAPSGAVDLSPFAVTLEQNRKDRLTGSAKRTFGAGSSVLDKQPFMADVATAGYAGFLPYTASTATSSDAAEAPPEEAKASRADPVSEQELSAPSERSLDPDVSAPRREPQPAQPVEEVSAASQPVSTFSLHVSDVSFRLAQAAIAQGQMPDPQQVRPEEFYNAFTYGDPTPTMAERISCRIEQSAHPFVQQRNLVRIALKVPAVGRGAGQPLRLTVLLDTSGSMEREDRRESVARAMQVLASLLGGNDRLTVIGFARQPRLLVDHLPGDQASEALDVIRRTPAEGGTNLEAALALAGEQALRSFDPGAQNRIVLLTDGAANLGNADPARLSVQVERLRQQGLAFDACGVGLEGIDDALLENLTRKGDGRYYVLNTPEAADEGFARKLAGAFRPAAENVKVQVRFNPARVGRYRLIGFEQHRLHEEDFRNDLIDAAELAAEEAAVAVYQVETLPGGDGEMGEVYVRFRDAATRAMVENSWTLHYDGQAPAFDRASPSLQLAGAAALVAEKLQGGPAGAAVPLDELAPVMNRLRQTYANETRVQELASMVEQLRRTLDE